MPRPHLETLVMIALQCAGFIYLQQQYGWVVVVAAKVNSSRHMILTVAVLPAVSVCLCVFRRKAREQKAYAKQVQAEKQKERAQEKKRQIQQVQQLRKQREKSVSHTGTQEQG
jgi:type VI protein secretion system component VasK